MCVHLKPHLPTFSASSLNVDAGVVQLNIDAICCDQRGHGSTAMQPGQQQREQPLAQQARSRTVAQPPPPESSWRRCRCGSCMRGCRRLDWTPPAVPSAKKQELEDLLLQAGGGGGSGGAGGSSGDGNGGGLGTSTATQQQQGGGTAGEAGEAGTPAPPAATRRCHHCGATKAPGVKLKLCAGCMHVYFCSADCQKASWREHKAACKAAGKAVAAAGQP